MSAPLFECHRLAKQYHGKAVVQDLSFQIAPGECLGLIGPNGAGKTTTLRMCLGLSAPDAGEIRAFGLPMPAQDLAIKARLGVVSQFDTLDPDFTCTENLLVFGRYFGLQDREIRARIPALLDFAALSHGREIAQGTPRALIAEHLEPEVVEVYGREAQALLQDASATRGPWHTLAQRIETSGETVFFYTHQAQPLLAELARHPGLRTLHRPANLEDLFLKLTGRQIRQEG